ncbi:hypothetical protein IFR05_002818 [Cadophora sp. M221]|nr:hypothetical protein IFR05_002818 [Cadophora sp. M221]
MDRVISLSTILQQDKMAQPALLLMDPELANTKDKVPLAQDAGPYFDSNSNSNSRSRSLASSATLRPSSLPTTASSQNIECAFGSYAKDVTSGDSEDQDYTTGESEETIIQQQPYLPLQHHKQKASLPNNTDENRQPRDKVRRPEPNPNSPSSTSAIHRTRTRSAPASTKTSLAGDETRPRKTRSRTVPDTSSATAGLAFGDSAATPTTPPSGWERRRSSVARLVIEKARSVKKMLFTDRRKSTEPNSPVIKEGRKVEEGWDRDRDRRGLSLDLPLHVSQDKSELEYIRRKNVDAMLGRNSDVTGIDYVEDEQSTWTEYTGTFSGTSRENSNRPTMTSNNGSPISASGATGIALYRSLLAQSVRVPLPARFSNNGEGDGENGFGKINPLKHLVRKKFRQNTHHTSPRLIVPALKTGYAAEELLNAAGTGNATALTQIHDFLDTLLEQKVAARKACTQPPPRPTSALKARLRAYPGAQRVVDMRPLPLEKLSGNRHVPSLAVATHAPFLRFKKVQSPYLSRVLSQKVKQKQKRNNWMDELAAEVEMGYLEGEWEDNVLEAVMGEGRWRESEELEREGWGDEDGWEQEPTRSKILVYKEIGREYKRAKDLADRMLSVVEKERELWEQERRDRKQAKRVAKGFERGDTERKVKGNGNQKAEKKLEDWKKEVEAW